MHGTNMRILRVENGWRLILGDWQLDTDGDRPTEKVAVDVAQLLAIVGAWAEGSEPVQQRQQVTGLDQLRSQTQSQTNGPIRPPTTWAPALEKRYPAAGQDAAEPPPLTAAEVKEAMSEPVDPPPNESHGFDAVTGEPKGELHDRT